MPMKKIIIGLVVVAILGGGFAFWYFSKSDESLDTSTKNINSAQSADNITEQSTPDGNWKVQMQDDVFGGYEIEEIFAGESVKKTAAGKSKEVSGSFTLTGNTLSDGEILIDTTKLKSSESKRDSTQQRSGLETDAFPEAIFKQSEPVVITPAIAKNVETTVNVPGQLTLHGQTNDVIFPLQASWDGKVIKVSGDLKIQLSDYGIKPPASPFVTVDDNGILKVQLLFVPAI